MSKTIDERVVSMQFDNSKFEKNVSTTMNTLDKLNSKLKLNDATKGLENVDAASKKVDMSALSTGVETVRTKFSALQVMAITALSNITNSAVNAGKRIAMSLTIDPIKTGLAEYETQLNAVQTILANTESKGSTLKDVNAALDELNTYADKTIYNFTEMTRNIGTFTAAGVDLDKSVAAIKGIANLAAVSGSTSQQASTAMYQLSQALSSGTVKLMDWNSVVNAGMGGQVFQDALKETARVHGIAIDDMIKEQGSFRETLQKGWLTSEVLLETLQKFTGDLNKEQLKSMGYTEKQIEEIIKLGQTANDAATKVKTFTQLMDTLKEAAQSGWSQTWKIIIGDFEEAKGLWTKVSDVLGGIINDSAEARNKLLSGAFTSGWKQLLGAGIMDEEGYSHFIKDVAKEHGVAIDEMIKEEGSLEKALKKGIGSGEITSEMFTEALSKLTSEYSNFSDEQLKNMGYTKDQVEALKKLNEEVQNGSVSMDEFVKKIDRLSGRELVMEGFSNIYKSLVSIITPIKEAFREIFPPATSEQLYKLLEGFRDLTAKLMLNEEQTAKLKNAFKGLFAVIDVTIEITKSIVKVTFELVKHLSGIGGKVLELSSSFGELIIKFRDYIKESDALSVITGAIIKFIDKTADAVKNLYKTLSAKLNIPIFDILLKTMKTVWNVVTKVSKAIGTALAEAFGGEGDFLDKIATFMSILNGGVFMTLLFQIKSIFSSLGETTSGIKGIVDGFSNILDGVSGTLEAFQTKVKAGALKEIAIAIAILAGSILVISLINPEKLKSSMAAITLSLGLLIGAFKIVNKGDLNSKKAAVKLTTLATALLITSFALAKLGKLSPKEMLTGLVAMAGALTILVGVSKLISKIDANKKGAQQLTKMAIMLLILSYSLKSLADMSWEEMGKGLTAMGGSLLIMVAALAVMSKLNINKKGAQQLTKMAIMLLILSYSLKSLADMSWEEMGKGLAAMSGSLLILVGALAVISKINVSGKGVNQIIKLTIVLLLLGKYLKDMAALGWEDMGRALTAMTGSLIILVAALAIISKVKVKAKAIGQTLVLTLTLLLLGASLKNMAALGWEDIARGLTAMTASLVILVGAMAILSKMSGGKSLGGAASLLVMVAAIGLLVPVLAALGNLDTSTIVTGLVTMAAALAILGIAGALLKSVVPSILSLAGSMLALGAALVLIGAGVALIGAGLSVLITAIVALITAIVAGGSALVSVLVSLIENIIQLTPLLFTSFAIGIIELCKVLTDGAPVIGEMLVSIFLAAIEALIVIVPALVSGLVTIIMEVIKSLVDFIPDLVGAIFELIIGIINSLAEYIPDLVQAGVNLLIKFLEGIVQALDSVDPEILTKGIKAVGFFGVFIAALAAIGALVPLAMVSVIAVGLLIAELALVLAAIGKLAQIPGLVEAISNSGALLQAVGSAIGQFIGGIAGGFAEGLAGSLPGIGSSLSTFMTNLQPFLDGLKELDASILENGKTLVSLILILTAANLIESLTSWLTGGTSIADFGAELGAFGKGIKDFANEVKGIDPATVKAAAEAGKNLGEMAKAIPTSGGLWDLLAGKNDLAGFADQLKGFGSGVKKFAEEVKGIDPEQVKMAAQAGKTLGEMAKTIPTSGGLWDLLAGENNMESFGGQLKGLGSGVKKFYEETKDVNVESVKAAAEAGKTLGNMASKLPTTGGLWNAIKGDMNMTNFGTQLKAFGTAMKDFVKEVSDIGDVSHIADQVQSLNESLRAFSLSSVDNLTAPFVEGQSKLADTISSMIQVAVETVKSKAVQFAEAGISMLDQFIKSVKSCQVKVKNAFLSIINDGVIPYMKNESMYSKFYSIGKYFVQGFASGISENSYLAAAKAEAMANAAAQAAAKALDEHSPSKVGYHIGDYFGYAFVDAISEYEAKAYVAGTDMGMAAKLGLQKAVSIASNLIENGIDSQPTIRPVLDLSDVAAGAGAINGMFGMTPSVGVLSNVNAISSAMNGNQNSANADVISAIADLKDTLENTSGDTYNLNGITYDNGSEIASAISTIVRAAKIERRR